MNKKRGKNMIDKQEKDKLRSAMNLEKEKINHIFNQILNQSFPEEVKLILFHAEFYRYGIGFSVKPHEDIYEEAPLSYKDGKPIYDDFASGFIDFTETLDMDTIFNKGELEKYYKAVRKLFAKWLHKRLIKAGGEESPLEFALTFADDYPGHYDLKTLNYNEG
jgi:hypothetical protein